MHCYYLSALDLRTFNITKVTDTESMFEECQRLKTIWCAGNWSQSATLTNSANMFKGCSSLEGDKGTTCDGVTDIDKTYARPDEGATAPGYFTAEKAEGEDEVYTFFKDGELTYLYDNLRNLRTSGITELYDPVNDGAKLRFQGYNDQITKVVIDESMKKAHLTSAYRMFFGGFLDNQVIDEFYSNKLSELIEIVGMNNLVTDEVTDMQYMFYGCSKLASLDARYFKTAKVINFGCMFQGCSSLQELDLRNFNIDRAAYIYGMFSGCTALRSIYCDADWSQSSAASVDMFHNCTSIVGGMGTTYDVNHLDASYARIDKGGKAAGYFTGEVPNEVYTVFDAATGTLTYYYDKLRYTRDGIIEVYDPVNDPTAKRFEGYNDQVTKAVIDKSMKNAGLTSTYSMFYNLTAMTKIEGMENLVTDAVTDMQYMFNSCESLTSLDLSHFNTKKVSNMRSMFQMCNALASLDLSKFNTEKVTNMNRMFFGCYRLVSLDLSKFNTSSVTDMGGMFTHCTSLTELDLNPFDIAKVQYMNGMFYGCTALKTIYCSKVWSQSTVVADSEEMFKGCSALVGVLGTKCDGENHIDMSYAHPDLGKYNPGYFTWNVVTPIKVYTEFDAATGTLTYYYNTQYYNRDGKVEFYDPFDEGERRFKGYHDQVTKAVIDESMRNAHLTSAYSMFYGGNERTGSGRVLYYALTSMTAIEGMENLVTDEVENMTDMFNRCSAITDIDLRGFNTENVTEMQSMFEGCSSLASLDLTPFNIAKVTDMRWMFKNCSALKTILCKNYWNQSAVTSDYSFEMFNGCTSIVGGKGTTYDENHTDITYARPDGGTKQPGYFFEQKTEVYTAFDATTGILTYYYDDQRAARTAAGEITELYEPVKNPGAIRFKDYHNQVLKAVIDESMKKAGLTSTRNMFYGGDETIDGIVYSNNMSSITEISGLKNLVTDEVMDMSYMFNQCYSLGNVDFSDFNTSNATDMSYMFSQCYTLKTLDLSNFNTQNVTNMSYMFYQCYALKTLDLSNFNTQNVTNMSYMFYQCHTLESLNLNGLDTRNVTDMSYMFHWCENLKTILCNEDWSKSEVLTSSDNMFYGCEALVGGNGTKYDKNYVDATYAHPDGENGLPGYFTSNEQLEPLPDDKETTFDFSLIDPTGSELLGITLGANDNYNATEGCMEISTTNTEQEIDQKLNDAFAGAASLKFLLPGTICFKLEKGKGEIEIDCQTVPGYTLQVRIAEYGTAYISSTVEQAQRGKATVNYDVTQPTYVVIYLQGVSTASSKISARIVTSKTAANEEGDEDDIDDDEEEPAEVGAYIYSITITPNTTDDIEQPNGSPSDCLSVRKLLIDGHVYILLPDGTMYNSTGAKVVGE